ncbi:MAG TPA: acetyl-CoA C-acetyltransferase [Bdellovibrionales bacterium]|nr:acetyl-CoA C-acyltransferase [Pseudobdellovibrionaceae bacterium]HAG90640.1 acetyl-CoA C-acetyltransferase [Bdellovibrionales bacterium]
MSMSKPVYIVAAQRTPVGSFQGSLSSLTAPQLGSHAIKAALKQSGLSSESVHECIFGEVLTAGVGQAPARQAALGAGLSNSIPCMTINKVCGSGLKSVMLGFDSIRLGQSEVVVAGGQESMSNAPYLLPGARAGYRMGNVQAIDSMVNDGLWDPYNNFHMGNAAELCVLEYKFTREEQDEFAIESYKKAQAALEKGLFKNEITPVEIASRKGTITVDTDEEPGKAMFDKMPGLRPAFTKDGSITAANASKIDDGAAALILASEEQVKSQNLKPLAKILGHATFAQDPKWFTTAPVGAMKKVFQSLSLSAKDIDLYEINEAFSVVTMAAMKDLEISKDRVNVHGGAVAIGHPIGASGARILTTLIYALQEQKKQKGLATLCIGGGEAVALVVERTV